MYLLRDCHIIQNNRLMLSYLDIALKSQSNLFLGFFWFEFSGDFFYWSGRGTEGKG